jgi:hypothetical protein
MERSVSEQGLSTPWPGCGTNNECRGLSASSKLAGSPRLSDRRRPARFGSLISTLQSVGSHQIPVQGSSTQAKLRPAARGPRSSFNTSLARSECLVDDTRPGSLATVDSYSARPGHAAPGFLTPIEEIERGLQLGPDRLRNSPWSSRRSESRLMAPERGLERGRRGVSFRQCPSGAAAYRVSEGGDAKVWLRHLSIRPCFYAPPGRCVATSAMLLSYVDFFSGLSNETPKKTRIIR